MKFFITYRKLYATALFMLVMFNAGMSQNALIKILPDSLPAIAFHDLVRNSFIPEFNIPLLSDSLSFHKDSFYTRTSSADITVKKTNASTAGIRRSVMKKVHPYIQFNSELYRRKAKIIAITTLQVLNEKVVYENETDFVSKYLVHPVDSSNYSVNLSIEKFNTSFKTMGVEMNFNSDSSDSYNTGNFANDFQQAIGQSIDLIINDKGIIKEIDTAAYAQKIKNTIINLYSGNETFLLNQQISITHQLPQELSVGQSWTDSLVTDTLHIVSTYTVKEFFRDNVILDVDAQLKQHISIDNGSKKYDALFYGFRTGEIEISARTGLVLKRNLKISMNGNVDNGDSSIPASTTVSIVDSLE